MEIADARRKLLELSQQRGTSLSALSRLLGRNSSYLQQFVRKGSPRKLEEVDRAILARYFGVAESELGEPEEISFAKGLTADADWVDVARLELGVSAGPGALDEGEQSVGSLRFSRNWLRQRGLDPARLSTVEVIGDSMEPTLRDGDEILVERLAGAPRDGVHVVRLDSALLVKRLDTSRPGRLMLLSDNRAYPPIEVDFGDAHVIGRAVWKSGRI
ncbi:MAG: S24 family peptidase [Novosphingobium sp.]|nr:S24 family peptidase [Novosphingobium sp.]